MYLIITQFWVGSQEFPMGSKKYIINSSNLHNDSATKVKFVCNSHSFFSLLLLEQNIKCRINLFVNMLEQDFPLHKRFIILIIID